MKYVKKASITLRVSKLKIKTPLPTGRKYYLLALLTGLTCLLALYVHGHRQGRTNWLDGWIIALTGGLQSGMSNVGKGIKGTAEHYILLVNAQKKNEELEREVATLRSKVTAQEELLSENKRLKEGLSFKETLKNDLLAARVVAHDVSPDYLGLRIDRGTRDGVRIGMGVIGLGGVVGRIQRATPFYSDVLTLVDPSSNIDVVVQRSRARGILSGQNKQLSCKLKYVDRLEDIMVNDVLITTDFGGIFPKGQLIGSVTAVIPNSNGILQTVTAKSAVDIYRLEEVFVVFPPAQPEKIIN